MNHLIEALRDIDFNKVNADDLLDKRDSKLFDAEWSRVYRTIESMKREINYPPAEKRNNAAIREKVFMKIFALSNNGELAEYVSDDFGMIADAKLLGYEDPWLNKLISCYENKTIPCGSL